MGLFRPFYVLGKKRYEVPDSLGRKIVFANDPESGFIVETHDYPPIDFSGGGPGRLEFSLPIVQPRTLFISKALTKLAYLSLCMVMPDFALSSTFDGVRHYLAEDAGSYVPYGERVILRAPRGVGLWYRLTGEMSDNLLHGRDLIVGIRIHHMQYFVPLLGDLDEGRFPEKTRLHLADTPAGTRKVDFSYSFTASGSPQADTDGSHEPETESASEGAG